MKKILFTLLLSGISISNLLHAQPVVIEDVSARGFSGVKSIGGEFFYTYYFGEKSEHKGMANFMLHIFDKDLKVVATKPIEVTKRSELTGSAFSGKYFFFIFEDVMKQVRTMVVLDKAGNIVKQKEDENPGKLATMKDNTSDIHVVNEDEFVVVTPEKEKKYGFDIHRIDKDLNEKWAHGYFPEKGAWTLIDSKYQNGLLYILRTDKPYALSNEVTYKVQAVDVATGNELFLTPIIDKDNDGGYPEFINVQEDGSVVTGGMYFKNNVYDDKNSDGFFYASIGKDGKLNVFNKTTWKSIKGQITGEYSSDLVGGKTKVLIEDMVRKTDGSYVLVAETFRKSSAAMTGGGMMRMAMGTGSSGSGSDMGFTVMDFLFINFDKSGNFTDLSVVNKPTREAVLKGSLGKMHGLEMAEWLYKCKFFCYRYTVDFDGKQYVMYKNEDGYKMRAYFLPLGNTTVDGIGNVDLDKWVSEGVNKMGALSKMMNGNQKTITSDYDWHPELYKNSIPAKNGQLLSYKFDTKGNLNIWLEPIPLK